MDAPVKGQGGSEITAEDVVNNLDVDELTHIIATVCILTQCDTNLR